MVVSFNDEFQKLLDGNPKLPSQLGHKKSINAYTNLLTNLIVTVQTIAEQNLALRGNQVKN